MRTAVIYARFSCSKQREASIDDQLRVCHEWCDREGYEVVNQYCDHAVSGRTDDRPEFQRMLSNAGESDIVLVYMMDRFSRDVYDAPIYKKRLRDKGVKVVSAMEAMPDGPEALLLEKIYEGLAAVESAHTSERTKRGMHGNALKGMHNGVRVYGYRFSASGGYEIDEGEAPVVREAFERRCAGESLNSIAKVLAIKGARTRRGAPCSQSMVANMVKNEKYTGVYLFDDIRIEGGMPAIVSREVYAMANRVRSRKRRECEEWGDYALSGRVVCGSCGRSMNGSSGRSASGRKYEYYACMDKCGAKPIPKDDLEGTIAETLRELVSDEGTAMRIAEAVTSTMDTSQQASELKAARRRAEQAKKGLDGILDAVQDGMPYAAVKDRMEGLAAMKEDAERDMERLKDAMEFDVETFGQFLMHGCGLDDRALLDAFVYQVIVEEEQVTAILNYDQSGSENDEPAYIVYRRVRGNSSWCPQRESNSCLSLERAAS